MNYCVFNDKIYLQTVGFATGVACGAEVANVYLGALEWRSLRLNLAATTMFQCGEPASTRLTADDLLTAPANSDRRCFRLFRRYIDDGFGLWRGTEVALLAALDVLYRGSGLCITSAVSTTQIIVLDMILFIASGVILTKCYQKPANRYIYLHYTSEHAPGIWAAFIRGEAIRYVKRCSLQHDFHIMIKLFVARLRLRGYPRAVISEALNSVSFKHRVSYLKLKPATLVEERLLPFVITFSKSVFDAQLHSMFRQNLQWLTVHERFKSARIFTSWKAGSKLSQQLITYRYPRASSSTAAAATSSVGSLSIPVSKSSG